MRDHGETPTDVSDGADADAGADRARVQRAAPGASIDRMLALWRAVKRCQPAAPDGDASATLVPAASPPHEDALADDGDDAGSTRRWFSPSRRAR